MSAPTLLYSWPGMSGYERAVSLLLVGHLSALTVDALLPPDVIAPPAESQPAPDTLSRLLHSPVDAAFRGLVAANGVLWRVTAPLRALTAPYLDASALYQQWQMFAVPARSLQYVELRTVWDAGPPRAGGGVVTSRALVFPIVQLGRGGWLAGSARDKAVANAILTYHEQRGDEVEPSPQLQALLTYFIENETVTAPSGTGLRRAELWYGRAPLPPPGSRTVRAADHRAVRRAALELPETSVRSSRARPRVGDVEVSDEITWTVLAVRDAQP